MPITPKSILNKYKIKKVKPFKTWLFLLLRGNHFVSFSEQQGNAPNSRQGNYGIDNSWEYSIASAENCRNEVVLEEPDQAPVQTTDNWENKTNPIKHIITSFIISIAEILWFNHIKRLTVIPKSVFWQYYFEPLLYASIILLTICPPIEPACFEVKLPL